MFRTSLSTAERYAAMLAGPARERGLMGPREVPRLWDRHLLNCALVTDLIGPGATVCDVGSGAGLPGLVIAIRRPDLRVTLLEPLLRRTTFLEEVVLELALSNVEVLRGRAESMHGNRTFDVVTSRAVADLGQLLEWSLPLAAEEDGVVLAMKGESAQEELDGAAETISRLGGLRPEVVTIEETRLAVPTTVVRVEAGPRRRITSDSAPRTATKPSRRRQKKRR